MRATLVSKEMYEGSMNHPFFLCFFSYLDFEGYGFRGVLILFYDDRSRRIHVPSDVS
jgi:hypothetical protein